jgi:hypothetical protein
MAGHPRRERPWPKAAGIWQLSAALERFWAPAANTARRSFHNVFQTVLHH